jgi:uncharacterized repeat protein (TIGR03803 family)
MKKAGFGKIACIVAILFTTAIVSAAQAYKTLSFNGVDGANPEGALIQGTDGSFYGTGVNAGAHGGGTAFRITPAGKLTTLYSFCSQPGCTDGRTPFAGLMQATNGNLYGVTAYGGANNAGTVFEISLAGNFTTLYSFCNQTNCTDGGEPYARLAEGANGNLYGTTSYGGTSNNGTVFEITPAGKIATLYNFCSQAHCIDGYLPFSGLAQGSNGNFYGTTYLGGTSGNGTVFEITPAGKFSALYSFCPDSSACSDGANPMAGLVLGNDGSFYGTTQSGGTAFFGVVFKITPAGTLTTLYSFCSQTNCADGQTPLAGLLQATDGNLYGTTYGYDQCTQGCGTIFSITPAGTLNTLFTFCAQTGCANGSGPRATLLQATDGSVYGTTFLGGKSQVCFEGCGTLFSLSVGLDPFVEAAPNFGKPGQPVRILGNNLGGTTSVNFHGTPATFTVVSNTYIEATVPTGVTTGTIEVTTPQAALSSNAAFEVLQ